MKLTDEDLTAMAWTAAKKVSGDDGHEIGDLCATSISLMRELSCLVLERAAVAISEGNIGYRPGNDNGDAWDDGYHGGIDYALEKVRAMKPDAPSEGSSDE